jgi:recombination associated protein RdgC
MQIIKNAWIYGCPLPAQLDAKSVEALEAWLFQPPAASQKQSMGFVPNSSTGELVTQLPDTGWSLKVRIDEKVLPASAVNKRVDEQVSDIEQRQDRKVYRKERLQIKDDVVASMLSVAFIKTRHVNVFYDSAMKLLTVATGSRSDAESVVTMLRHCMGSLRAIPLHIEGLQHLLTDGARRMIEANLYTSHFRLGNFFVFGDFIQLESPLSGNRIAVKSGDGEMFSSEGIGQAIESGYQVSAAVLVGTGCRFKMTPQQALKSIVFDDPVDPPEDDQDAAMAWLSQAVLEVATLRQQIVKLLELTGSMFPVFEEA